MVRVSNSCTSGDSKKCEKIHGWIFLSTIKIGSIKIIFLMFLLGFELATLYLQAKIVAIMFFI